MTSSMVRLEYSNQLRRISCRQRVLTACHRLGQVQLHVLGLILQPCSSIGNSEFEPGYPYRAFGSFVKPVLDLLCIFNSGLPVACQYSGRQPKRVERVVSKQLQLFSSLSNLLKLLLKLFLPFGLLIDFMLRHCELLIFIKLANKLYRIHTVNTNSEANNNCNGHTSSNEPSDLAKSVSLKNLGTWSTLGHM